MIIRSLFKNQRRLFWALHLGGWLAWGVILKYAYTWAIFEDTAPRYFLYVMVITVIGGVISLGLRMVYRFLWNRPAWARAVGFLGGCGIAGYLWMASRSAIYYRWFESRKEMEAFLEEMGSAAELFEKVAYMDTYLSSCTIMVAWSVLYFAIKYYQVFQEVQKSALRSAAMAHEAQLKIAAARVADGAASGSSSRVLMRLTYALRRLQTACGTTLVALCIPHLPMITLAATEQ